MTEILVPIACALLIGLFLAAVVQPILTHKHAWRRATGGRRQLLELTERKEQLYASIKEMEFDHSLGKISQDDYDTVRVALEAEAVDVLRRLDSLGAESEDSPQVDLDARIESDLAALRIPAPRPTPRPTPGPAAATAVTPADTGDAAHKFCHGCGKPRTSEYRFCPHCGQSFEPTA